MTTLKSNDYNELVRASTKGSKKATEDLFTLGESLLVNSNLDGAAKVFKDAAISYRIAAFRNAAELETTQNEVKKLIGDLDVFREWITKFPNGHEALPKTLDGLARKTIETLICGEFKHPSDPEVIRHYRFLNCALELSNVDYAKLNGNRPVFICEILFSYFGIDNRMNFDFTNSSEDVRIGIDLLAHTIEEKIITNARL